MDPNNIDKFGRAMANFNAFAKDGGIGFKIIPSVVSFKLVLALCKIFGVFAMWSKTINRKFLGGTANGKDPTVYIPVIGIDAEYLATLCFAILFFAVGMDHYKMKDDDFATPFFLFSLASTKLMNHACSTAGSVAAKIKKTA